MPISNSLWVDVVDIPPYENIGWQVKCRSLFEMSRVLVENPKFISMTFSKELNDEGGGSIDFDMDSKLFQETLSSGVDPKVLLNDAGENVWEIYYNGKLIFQWIAENAVEKPVDSSGNRIATVSGPGVAHILKWALILPLGSPNHVLVPPKNMTKSQSLNWGVATPQLYRFRNTPIMSDYITLLQDAQKRGSVPWIEPMFSRTKDSAGKKWIDTKPPIKAIYQRNTVAIGPWAHNSSTLDPLLTSRIDAITAPIVDTFTTGGKQLSNAPGMVIVTHGDSSESSAVIQARGEAVKSRLVLKKPLGTYTIVNKGSSMPVASNATTDGASLNRRVEVTYTALVPPKVIPEHRPIIGVNLLDFLKYITGSAGEVATIELDWMVRPPKAGHTKFRLDARPQIGTHREKVVRFFESNSIISKERTRDRTEITNYYGIQDNVGYTSFYATRDSIAKYGQREAFQNKGDTVGNNPPGRQRAAKQASLQFSKEKSSWTLTVADRKNRAAFIDYDVGDWIGVENTEPYSPTLKMSELYDEFTESSLDTTKWSNTGESSGEISIISGGGLRLRGVEATKFARVTTVDDYNFWNSAVSIQIDSMIFGGDGYAQFKVQRFDNHYFSWWCNGSVIRAYYHSPENEGGGLVQLFQGVWNPIYYKYLRITHRSSTNEVIWESSSNARNWTYRARRKTNTLEWWLYKVTLEEGDNTAPVSGGTFDVRRVNTQAGATSGLMNIDRTPGYGTDVHRVRGIAINIDSSSNHTTELTLESSLEIRAKRQARRLEQIDNLMWRNNLPGGVLNIVNNTYGTITATQQIVQGGAPRTLSERPLSHGLTLTEATNESATTAESFMGTGSSPRWNNDLGTWVPMPNVWIQDAEPEYAPPGTLWTPLTPTESSGGGGD